MVRNIIFHVLHIYIYILQYDVKVNYNDLTGFLMTQKIIDFLYPGSYDFHEFEFQYQSTLN